ncbi:DMT family transporter [Flavisphingomonas formosensis]|uniref:DMT family transporter n=1 Tax=Flavisphingomonas formosensis TaxID=861534 RepID=UPI001E64F7DB|nr:multidrug efflux SMR transporter [Sphingomonas formosensis]
MNPTLAWGALLIGGMFEVGFTTCLRYVEGFRNIPWTIGFLVCALASMALLEVGARIVPMGTAYLVWGGIGAIGTVAVGILFYQEPAGLVRLLLMGAIIACITGLRMVGNHA